MLQGNDVNARPPTAPASATAYVHVSDLASAHVAALDWLAKGNTSQSINLGNGRGCSVAEVVRTAE